MSPVLNWLREYHLQSLFAVDFFSFICCLVSISDEWNVFPSTSCNHNKLCLNTSEVKLPLWNKHKLIFKITLSILVVGFILNTFLSQKFLLSINHFTLLLILNN